MRRKDALWSSRSKRDKGQYLDSFAMLVGEEKEQPPASRIREREAEPKKAKKIRLGLTEDQEQIMLATWLDKNNILFYASANGGSRNPIEAAKLKRCGVRSGVPDICLPIPTKRYHGLYIELKRISRSKISENQEMWLTKLNQNGYLAKVAYGFEEAKQIISDYLSDS